MVPYDAIRARIVEAVPFVAHVGIALTDLADGTATATLPQRPEGSNHVGSQHAGALYTLGETASGAAVAGALAPVLLTTRLVATRAVVDYRHLAKGTITAAGRTTAPGAALRAALEAEGKAVFGAEVTMTDEAGTVVATLAVDWHARAASPG